MTGGRIPLWDNARFLCMVLVVMGHAIQRQTLDSDGALAIYLFIFSFHIPAFAIISGYFSTATPPGTRQLRRVLTDLVVPYVIFEAIWSVIQFLVEGRSFNPTLPSWTLWFLLALAIFRLVLPYLALLRWPLAWTVLLSVAVGYFSNVDSTFSLSRAIGILPFFVLGWQLREWGVVDRWRDLRRSIWAWRGVAAAVLGGWFAVTALNIEAFRAFGLADWFFYRDAYAEIGAPTWWAGAVRLGFIVLAVVLSAAFLALIPRRETFLSALGQATMYVYLLHTFVLYPVRESGVLRGELSSPAWVAAMLIASVVISVVLASPPVRRIFRPLVEPKPRWPFTKTAEIPGESRPIVGTTGRAD